MKHWSVQEEREENKREDVEDATLLLQAQGEGDQRARTQVVRRSGQPELEHRRQKSHCHHHHQAAILVATNQAAGEWHHQPMDLDRQIAVG